jgi:hypothetical protein
VKLIIAGSRTYRNYPGLWRILRDAGLQGSIKFRRRLGADATPRRGAPPVDLDLLKPFRYGHCMAFSDAFDQAIMEYLYFNPDCVTAMPFAGFMSLLGVSPYQDPAKVRGRP